MRGRAGPAGPPGDLASSLALLLAANHVAERGAVSALIVGVRSPPYGEVVGGAGDELAPHDLAARVRLDAPASRQAGDE